YTSPVVINSFSLYAEVCSSKVPVVTNSGDGSASVTSNGSCLYCGNCYCFELIGDGQAYSYKDCSGNTQNITPFVDTKVCSSSYVASDVGFGATNIGTCISG
ncbi:MAG: hypothetical protein ACK55Z_12920, partial [bacterium]